MWNLESVSPRHRPALAASGVEMIAQPRGPSLLAPRAPVGEVVVGLGPAAGRFFVWFDWGVASALLFSARPHTWQHELSMPAYATQE